MASYKIAENVFFVGAIDYDIREFHGYKTPFGTTYNSYLIIDEKITLIDCVKASFAGELIKNVSEITDPSKIDYIVVNHVEPDHSGALGEVLKHAKNAKIIASPNGEKGLESYYKCGWPVKTVKTGDGFCTGKYNFKFILMPMLHWPDSMATYCPELKTLFPNDAFGQHFASAFRFSDELVKEALFERVRDYYANIIMPFGSQVKKALDEVAKLEIKMIAPSHGLIWRNGFDELMQRYADWADDKSDENLAVIAYDTMWGATAIMAENLTDKFKAKGKKVEVFDLKKRHISEVMSALIDAKTIAVGSSTLNRNMLPNVAAFLTYMKGLSPKKKRGLAFGSYGWSGESVGGIEKVFSECGFDILPQIKVKYMP